MSWASRIKSFISPRAATAADANDAVKALASDAIAYLHRTPPHKVEVRKLMDLLLVEASNAGASDVHLDPFEDHLLVRFRIDGILHDVTRVDGALKRALANRIKVMANLKIHEQRVPQDGKAQMEAELGGFELRVSLSPMVHGEKITLRLFRSGERRFNVRDLGFDPQTLMSFLRLLEQPSGMVILAGPVGSGKTTTLYSSLTFLAETRGERLNITSVEDPVECSLPRVNQASVNVTQGFTYPVALRSILRHDPQVIMIGEIRDEETASIAVRASLSGHLVFTTVHSGSAAGAFARLTNLGVDPALLSTAVLGILNLRLVRLNCAQCLVPYEPTPEALARSGGVDRDAAHFRKGGGCPKCGFTGFRGRTPITELLLMNPELERAVNARVSTSDLHKLAMQSGMKTLAQSALARAMTGDTTLEEVASYLSSDQG